jgi:hypothetical protein
MHAFNPVKYDNSPALEYLLGIYLVIKSVTEMPGTRKTKL